MKATEIKYLLLLEQVTFKPKATHTDMATALDVPQSLVNRYLKRLARWGAVSENGGLATGRSVTLKGQELLRRASWEFLAFFSASLERLHREAVNRLGSCAQDKNYKRIVLYGATPMACILRGWAREAGLQIVALCDEERHGSDVVRLEDLDRAQYDAFLLCDWGRAGDRVLLGLLEHYAPVMNLFVENGHSAPGWR